MCQTSKNSWASNYTERCLIINLNGQLWYELYFLPTPPPPDSALQSLLDSLQKNRCSALRWEINSYHSYVPKIQGPGAAVLRMLINSSPYAPIFLPFQSITFSQDSSPQYLLKAYREKQLGNVHLTDRQGRDRQSNAFSSPFSLLYWSEQVGTAQMTNVIETMPRDAFVIFFFPFIGNSNRLILEAE